MPAKLVIKDGPPFKKFVFLSTLFAEDGWILTFTLDPERSGGRKSITFTVIAVGNLCKLAKIPEDDYIFIGHTSDLSLKKRHLPSGQSDHIFPHRFYLGQYNTRTRVGNCVEIDAEELFNTAIAPLLFGQDLADGYRKNLWMK